MARSQHLIAILLVSVFTVALLHGASAEGITLNTPRNLTANIAETCNETCVSSCNATWNAYAKWFKDDLSSDDAKRCDVCATAYYAQDFNVDIGKCPCKTLEQFRKLTKDKTMVPDDECVDCCLMWAIDTLTFEEDCKEPQVLIAKDKQDDERNACGFTIKKLEENPNYEDSSSKSDSDSKDEKSGNNSDDDKSSKDDEEAKPPTSYTYDYSSLGSQFDTCKCICKGLAPCKAPAEPPSSSSSSSGSSQTASSFFNSASFSNAGGDSALSAIMP